MQESVQVAHRFYGMPGLALGGYLCGLAARELGPISDVSLRRPVRIGVELILQRSPEANVLRDSNAIIAEGRRRDTPLEDPPSVSLAEADLASQVYPGFRAHLFPDCYCCGPTRAVGDGLRLFTGPVRGRDVVACAWTPDQSLSAVDGTVRTEILWAAVDCPGIWALIVASRPDSADRAVTGTIAVDVRRPIRAGDRYIVIGWPLGREGRKLFAGAAICAAQGQPLLVARQTMILTEHGIPLGLDGWASPVETG